MIGEIFIIRHRKATIFQDFKRKRKVKMSCLSTRHHEGKSVVFIGSLQSFQRYDMYVIGKNGHAYVASTHTPKSLDLPCRHSASIRNQKCKELRAACSEQKRLDSDRRHERMNHCGGPATCFHDCPPFLARHRDLVQTGDNYIATTCSDKNASE